MQGRKSPSSPTRSLCANRCLRSTRLALPTLRSTLVPTATAERGAPVQRVRELHQIDSVLAVSSVAFSPAAYIQLLLAPPAARGRKGAKGLTLDISRFCSFALQSAPFVEQHWQPQARCSHLGNFARRPSLFRLTAPAWPHQALTPSSRRCHTSGYHRLARILPQSHVRLVHALGTLARPTLRLRQLDGRRERGRCFASTACASTSAFSTWRS